MKNRPKNRKKSTFQGSYAKSSSIARLPESPATSRRDTAQAKRMARAASQEWRRSWISHQIRETVTILPSNVEVIRSERIGRRSIERPDRKEWRAKVSTRDHKHTRQAWNPYHLKDVTK